MGDNTKQVRVDNWGIFFLQRLQMFFSKTDYCDMTLQFEGNVQLKVHRLVMNACTEYFHFLEQTCTMEENVIMMPSDLQADVIVPIVNFMYTGMLEFHLSIFDRLYKTAQIMNITILTKLLDAQKQPFSSMKPKKKVFEPVKKPAPRPSHSDLPAPLPGRKLPVWKRKSIPTPPSHSLFSDTKWSAPVDPLSLPDNTPKPTRFEWPDEDLPALNLMDTTFEDISYTSKPLMTQEEENRASTSFDDLKQLPNANRSTLKKGPSPSLDMEEMKNYVKEQKIRSGLSQDDDGVDNDLEIIGEKRKASSILKTVTKKVRFDESDSKTTTISIATDGKAASDLNHEKIVTEILKKYPQLVKKNKNIRLKIMAKNKSPEPAKVESIQVRTPRTKPQEIQKIDSPKTKTENKAPWICDRCSTDEEPMEFVLYYLFRKHMTDIHNEKFDPKLCKYCGQRCNKHNLLMYHMYTKHGMKPPPSYSFPKCDQCPHIALSLAVLNKHKLRHTKNEIQCVECKLTFTSQATLTSHMQITGHTGKTNASNYDCQYCTKRLQSSVNLFTHVRSQHRNEAIRDGIVSIDEVDEVDDFEEEDSSKDEYILPEIIDDTPIKKVNILSNVKVQDRQEHHSRHQQLQLEPSSEAEALNNVATGIATSLGLVDIVVLNDNQQLFLQSNQQNYSGDQNEQPEFILPELTGRETYTQAQNEVITDGVITQSMLSSGDIGSTDELVMVLTDHDYGDNQEEISNENSNIVVLYSHPVDGQQDQYITSQGNIMVNSQTGLIEIRNGATITTTASQVVVNPQEPHIESIEMIQREIESHSEIKTAANALYEEETKPSVICEKEAETETEPNEPEVEQPIPETLPQSETLIERLKQGEQLEVTSMPLETQPMQEQEGENREYEEVQTETEETHDEVQNTDSHEEQTVINEVHEEQKEEEMVVEIEENQDKEADGAAIEEREENQNDQNEDIVAEVDKSTESLQDKTEEEEEVVDSVQENETTEVVENATPEPPPPPETIETQSEEQPQETDEKQDMTEVPKEVETSEATPVNEAVSEELMETNEISNEDLMETSEANEENIEDAKNQERELSHSDSSTSQFNDENSQSSQESHKDKEQEAMSTKIAILDDWEDTDSQQSDQNRVDKEKVAKTVDKLMDDWEEEEEDESRKEADG